MLHNAPGFDSTNFVRLILALEAEFGIKPREDEVDPIATLGGIAALVRGEVPCDG